MAYGGFWSSAKRQRTDDRRRNEVPELNANDAGFIPEVVLPNFAAAAQRGATSAAHQSYAQVPACILPSLVIGQAHSTRIRECSKAYFDK